MLKVPGYDFNKRPYVLLKDSRFISLIDVSARRSLPLIRSPYDGEPISHNNFNIKSQKDGPIDHNDISLSIDGNKKED